MKKTTVATATEQEAVELLLLGTKTVREVAEMYGVSASTINRWKKSHAQPQSEPEAATESATASESAVATDLLGMIVVSLIPKMTSF